MPNCCFSKHSHNLCTSRTAVLFRINFQFTLEYYFKCGSQSKGVVITINTTNLLFVKSLRNKSPSDWQDSCKIQAEKNARYHSYKGGCKSHVHIIPFFNNKYSIHNSYKWIKEVILLPRPRILATARSSSGRSWISSWLASCR